MWKEIALVFIGLFVGFASGSISITLLLRSFIGDDFEIIKPKVKGQDNELRIDQQNIIKRWQRKKNKQQNQNLEN